MRALLAATALTLGLNAHAAALGVVYKGDQTLVELSYANPGKSPVQIGQIVPSCDCLESMDAPGQVAPAGVFKAHFIHHAQYPGSIDVDVRLLGASATETLAVYPIRGFVAERAWVASRADAIAAGALLVDTRAAAQYSEMHAARAVNVPAFALKTRSDLKKRRIVLMDDGVDPSDLLGVVEALRKQGFTEAKALEGGLPGWIRGGGAVEGSHPSVLGVARITAAEFARSSRDTPWRIVQLGDPIPATLNLEAVRRIDHPEEIGSTLSSLSATWGDRPAPHILIVASQDAVHARLEARLGTGAAFPVYYLKGGSAALARFRAEQLDASTNTGVLVKAESHQATVAIAGRCSSCGK
jgi:rhodanese-related sulfurtransferase